MRKVLIGVILLALTASVVSRFGNMYSARDRFGRQIEEALNLVDENTIDKVRQTLVREGRRLGFELAADDVLIVYADTGQLTLPQQIVAGGLPVQFTNRRVEITAHCVTRIFGVRFHSDITRSMIKQVRAPRMLMRPDYERMLEEPAR
jgi:hypothetical protein